MADVLTFTNAKWDRLEPLYPASHEIRCLVVYNFLDWEVPRYNLSVFECKFLDQIKGYRNRESFNFLKDTNSFYDARTTKDIYGVAELPQNVRWSKSKS